MNMKIRYEEEKDFHAVEELTRNAFWNLYFPGCDEHFLCHVMRSHKDFVKDLDFIALVDGNIVGSIMYTKSWLIAEDGETQEIVSFGPLSVHPDFQRKGIGTALIEKTKKIASEKNIPAIAIYGDPHNYCKHGFKNGIDYNVSNMEGEYPLGLLLLEIEEGFFGDKKWKLKQSEVYNLDNVKVEEFDRKFEYKEKKKEYSQEFFKMMIRAYLRNFS